MKKKQFAKPAIHHYPDIKDMVVMQEALALWIARNLGEAEREGDVMRWGYYTEIASLLSNRQMLAYLCPLVYLGREIVEEYKRELYGCEPTQPELKVVD